MVTGVAGFIASKTAEFLLEDGHNVVGLDNMNDAYDVRLKDWRLSRLQKYPNFTFHRLDIADLEGLGRLFEFILTEGQGRKTEDRRPRLLSPVPGQATTGPQLSAVINLAARAGVRQSVGNPWVYYETNVTGTLNLLEMCREYGIKKFILASTSSLYGRKNPMPYKEDANTDNPLSPYAASKKAAETLCYTYHYLCGLDIAVLRYFTVYGPAGRPDMSLFRFVQWIMEGRPVTVYGNGTQSRDFTYVDDIARGTIAAVNYLERVEERRRETGASFSGSWPPVYEIVNLGSDTPVVLADVVRLVETLVDRKAEVKLRPMHPADVPATWADIGKAETLLGWRPKVSFEEGVRNLVNWYKENRAWAKKIDTGDAEQRSDMRV
jgi:nucleoside-diphosphate-sugar epimerase